MYVSMSKNNNFRISQHKSWMKISAPYIQVRSQDLTKGGATWRATGKKFFWGVFNDFLKQCLVWFYSGIWLFLLHCQCTL